MATKLSKPIVREMMTHGHLAGRDIGTVIVTLEPGDLITFRQKGKRTRYQTTLQACMNLALMGHIYDKYTEAVDMYEKKKKAGYKSLRRPRRPKMDIFNPILQRCIVWANPKRNQT